MAFRSARSPTAFAACPIRAPKRRSATSSSPGISAVELMGGPVESFAGMPRQPAATAAVPGRWRRRRGRAAAVGGPGGGCRWRRGHAFRRRHDGRLERSAVVVGPGQLGGGGGAASRRRDVRRGGVPRRGTDAGGSRPRRSEQTPNRSAAAKVESVAHERVDGHLQEAAQDVQRRRRDHLRVKQLSPNMVTTRSSSTRSTSPKRSAARTRRSSCRRTQRSSSGSATSR